MNAYDVMAEVANALRIIKDDALGIIQLQGSMLMVRNDDEGRKFADIPFEGPIPVVRIIESTDYPGHEVYLVVSPEDGTPFKAPGQEAGHQMGVVNGVFTPSVQKATA